MKGIIFILLSFISLSHADPRGKPYEREKVCQEFNVMGKDKFSALAVIMNSRKYSNATFEEIGHLMNAIVSLAEKCCVKGAASDCYDKGASDLSIKSCDPKSPFPKHPGIASCCVHKGLERKLCLADLKQPPKEFPTYLEQSNEELCDSFRKDPQTFSARFLYEYSSNYAEAPLLVVIDSTTNYLNMVATCCTSEKPSVCFLKQRLQRHPVHLLTVMSNRLCSRYASYGEEKLKFSASIMFGQKVPSAAFKDVMPIVEQGTQVLAKCCNSMTEDCIKNELSVHIKQVCKKLSSKDSRVTDCCNKSPVDTLHCLHSMPASEPISLPKLQWPTTNQLCKKGKSQELEKYTFELARRNTKLPEVFLDKLHVSIVDVVKGCCNSQNPQVCLENKKPQLNEEINQYITEGNKLCADYNTHPFSTFKERLVTALRKRVPKLNPTKLDELVEQTANLASTCCIINAPPVYCKEKINKVIGKTCSQETCLLQ
ncbi:vitamin D-binding protein [Spea bombifrons]|uniref:vitamin D-binding protein n=1 Tax=Spea bombifrons TaxID=233779 RepID=UPI00234BAB45|nr:vitamin D-binding protein [Spea bombifrons]